MMAHVYPQCSGAVSALGTRASKLPLCVIAEIQRAQKKSHKIRKTKKQTSRVSCSHAWKALQVHQLSRFQCNRDMDLRY